MRRRSISFTLNGSKVRISIPVDMLLLDMLREELALTGTKRGCENGECGACTVLIDGQPVTSCIYPAVKVHGREVTTVEGLGGPDDLHPLQSWFLKMGAVQCGFCTPGLLMSAKALLDKNAHPTPEEIRDAIVGNLCRCTGYQKVVEAVMAAAAQMRGEDPKPRAACTGGGALGRSIIKVDGLPKVTGQALFAEDLKRPGMLHGCMVTSPFPHARIEEIDPSRALKIRGVVAVLTAGDVPGAKTYGVIIKDQPFLPDRKVRYVGEPVAVVIARDMSTARRAAREVEVKYEPLPAVFDPIEAMNPESVAVHEGGNVLHHRKIRKGNIQEGFSLSEVMVQREFVTHTVEHAYIEPEAALSYWDGDILVVHCCSQGPHYHRQEIARMLDLPENRVRVIQAATGGGFGGKIDLSLQHFVALGTYMTGKPVKMVWRRAESFRASTKRHAFHMRYKMGATRDGRLLAAEAVIVGNTGAYASYGPAVLTRAATMAIGPYECPHVHVDAYAVYTNTQIAGAMRGFGAPQLSPCHEPLLDEIARICGLSPVEIRRRNMLRVGSSTLTRQILEAGVGALDTLEVVAREMEQGTAEGPA
jgi:CO/xanthine dehydrogenase Mo-binding subunit/aerobic-type carbon monoxide dehydrogenase small subunit (CoxS/CutS family)